MVFTSIIWFTELHVSDSELSTRKLNLSEVMLQMQPSLCSEQGQMMNWYMLISGPC